MTKPNRCAAHAATSYAVASVAVVVSAGFRTASFARANVPGPPADAVGQRIFWLAVGNRPLERHRIYTLGTKAFMTTAGTMDGCTLPTESLELGGDLRDVVCRALAKGPIKPSVDGRIVRLRQPGR